MEVAISAVGGELVSRFISFLLHKYNPRSEEKVLEMLQHLLMRACVIVEEADTRYITNSGMMIQLKTLTEAMYRGYSVVDKSRYQANNKVSNNDPSGSSSLYLAKRSRTTTDKGAHLESHGAFESLEIAVANMKEFVVLLGGFERMSRSPYDVYLYTDNFMFGRQSEKQKLLSFLLQHNNPHGDHAPEVLPIIGGACVGKKTLVAHACGDERVRLRFSSVLHLNGDNLMSILDHGRTMKGMLLVVIEFSSDIGQDDWEKFHSFAIRMGKGSKIIILSRLQTLARLGSVTPIFLGALSYNEFRYLFKTMAFGSVDPAEHPRLVQIADEFAKLLYNVQVSLIAMNSVADLLRRNLDVPIWRSILDKGLRMVKRNISMYGADPTMLEQQGQPIDVTDFALHPLSMKDYTMDDSVKGDLPRVRIGELITNPSVRPKEDFILVLWESKIPPYKSFTKFATTHVHETHEGSSRKRRGAPF